MRKVSTILLTGVALLSLSACSSGSSTKDSGKSKSQIQKEAYQKKVNKRANAFSKNPTDATYLRFVRTALGSAQVKTLKTASNKFKVVQLTGLKFTSDTGKTGTIKFGNGMSKIIKTVRKTSYAKPGISFIQYDKDDSTQFTYSYTTNSLNKFKLLSGYDDHGDEIFEDASSYYLEPNFSTKATALSMTKDVKIGPVDSQQRGLNTIVMETFD